MTNLHEEYHKRNVLLTRIVWGQAVFYMLIYLYLGLPLYTYIDIAAQVALVALPLTLLTWRRKWTEYIPYLFGTLWLLMLVVCNLYFSYSQHIKILNPISFLISAVMVAQYPRTRPIVYYGVISFVTLNGFFLADFQLTVVSHPVLFMNTFLLTTVGMLAVSSHMTERYHRTAARLNGETREMREEMAGLWSRISEWGTQLDGQAAVEVKGALDEARQNKGAPWDGHRGLQVRLEQLIKESNRQHHTVHAKNQLLEQYAKQIEQLTLQEERNRLSQELHDQIGHTYTGMTMGLESIRYLFDTSPEEARVKLDHLLELVGRSFREVRASIHQLAEEGTEAPLSEKLRRLAEDWVQGGDVRLTFEAEGLEPEVSAGVRHALYRCQQEALTNARRHGQADAVRVHLLFAEEELVLRIADNGVGSPNLQLGFGLRAMRERLQAVQGHLQVYSRAGEGVEVVCSVPLRRRYERKEIRVVIADDQPLIRESLSLLLEREPDLDVVGTAADGAEALALCLEQKPSVALLDINMPGLDGVEVTRRLKEQEPGMRVVLMTTFDDLGLAMEAIRFGAEGYLFKSIHPKKLIDSLRLVYSGGTLISYELAQQLVEERSGGGAAGPVGAAIGALAGGAGQGAANGAGLAFAAGADLAAAACADLPQPANADQRTASTQLPSTHQPAAASPPSATDYGLMERDLAILSHLAQGLKYKEIAARMQLSENTIRNYISIIYSKLGVDNRTQALERVRGLL